MTVDLKRKVSFFIIELILGITFGLFAVSYSERLSDYTDSIIIALLFVYFISIIGIAIPGYFFLKFHGNKEVFVAAIFSSTAWAFLSIFLYIILAFFVNLSILQNRESGLIFPVIFGVIGFNHFAYNLKNNTSP